MASFLQIHTKGGRSPLELTPEHLVFVSGKSNPVRADSIKTGDILQGGTGTTANMVTDVNKVLRQGLYNPMTPSGSIVVDGVTASTYISFQEGADEWVELQGGVQTFLSNHVAVHIAVAPFRAMCMGIPSAITGAVCNSYNEDGLPVYVSGGISIIHWGMEQNIVVQSALLAAVMMLCGLVVAMEYTFGFAVFGQIVVAGMGYIAFSKKTISKVKQI